MLWLIKFTVKKLRKLFQNMARQIYEMKLRFYQIKEALFLISGLDIIYLKFLILRIHNFDK